MLNGNAMGTQIANSLMGGSRKDISASARASITATWIKIAKIICIQIQTTGDVIVPPSPVVTNTGGGTCTPMVGKVV